MAKELNEDSGFKVSIKTLLGIGAGMATIISMWFMLQADIEDAKRLPEIEIPPPEISRMEFDMKDQNIRLTIQNTADDVAEIKEDIQRLEEKIDKLR
jgi:tRNA threonylcarbamoyladenosine modification (KEOPS) complex  Pcc1 subunit